MSINKYKHKLPLIPRIIHQQWKSEAIPAASRELVESVVKNHPQWDYWFWTNKDCDCYIKTHHPELLHVWNSYEEVISRADVMRYVLMHDFGGFYVDLDVKCFKPLDVFTYLAHSIVTHETYESAFLWHFPSQAYINPTVIASRAKHPFYRKAIEVENLEKYRKACPKLPVHCTGPYYMDNMYQEYIQESLANMTPENDVMVLHPR